jgi:hypothetical protein
MTRLQLAQEIQKSSQVCEPDHIRAAYFVLDSNYGIQSDGGDHAHPLHEARPSWASWGVSMSDTATVGIDRPEEEILTHEVSDEALETASGIGCKQAGNITLACTYFYICPI